jgi:hypothetical protein
MGKNVDVQSKNGNGERIVVAGIGLLAADDLQKGGYLLDSAAVYFKDPPPSYGKKEFDDDDGDSYRNVVIGGQVGYFQLRSYSENKNTPWASTSFYMNEARARDGTKPNIKWRSHYLHEKGQAPVFRWQFQKNIKKGEELLAKYVS